MEQVSSNVSSAKSDKTYAVNGPKYALLLMAEPCHPSASLLAPAAHKAEEKAAVQWQ